jgi:hypothetical protein
MALRDRDLAGNGAFGVFGQITGAVERRTSEEKLGEVSAETIAAVRQAVLRAHAAASAGDKNACEQALAEVQCAISRPRARARFQAALPRGLRRLHDEPRSLHQGMERDAGVVRCVTSRQHHPTLDIRSRSPGSERKPQPPPPFCMS